MAGAGIAVGIDESTPLGVIIAGLEVIQPGVYGTLLTTGPFLAPIRAAASRRPDELKNVPKALQAENVATYWYSAHFYETSE